MASEDHFGTRSERWQGFMRSVHPEGNPQAAQLMEELRRVAHQLYQLGEASLASAGLSYAQYRVLMSLMFCEWAGADDGLNPSEISAHQGTSRNTVSALIRQLEDDKFVDRHLDNDDRRRFNIHLTDAGRQIVLDHVGRHAQMIDALFSVLSPEEIETLSRLLHALNQRAQDLKS
jgi:MarR family 2-MHQ and catechol resistance regulon transcriptional repressor